MASQYPGGSGVFFYREAADLERALRTDPSPRARELAAEAKRLTAVFNNWAALRADGPAKAEAIRQLFNLNRAVLEYTGASSKPRAVVPKDTLDDDDDE